MAMQQNTFNETFDSYIRVYQRAAKEATKDREGPIGPFQNCMVCSVPPGGKNMEGRYIYMLVEIKYSLLPLDTQLHIECG